LRVSSRAIRSRAANRTIPTVIEYRTSLDDGVLGSTARRRFSVTT
jgi:hypothetical protein